MKKTVRVPFDGSESVQFTKEVGQNEIDPIQSAQGGGDICKVDVAIIDTFGEAQEA